MEECITEFPEEEEFCYELLFWASIDAIVDDESSIFSENPVD